MKGQLFIVDVLASVLILTIIVSFTAWELDQIHLHAQDAEYDKISFLASDLSNMAVKNLLANRTFIGKSLETLPNWLDQTKWWKMDAMISQLVLPPYGYETGIPVAALYTKSGTDGCLGKNNVAISRRIVYINGKVGELYVKVCI